MSARFGKLALALSAAMPMLPAGLQAQDNVTIGPPQLRGFQLPGTTTTAAPQEVPPATPQTPPAAATPAPAQTPATPDAAAPVPAAPTPAASAPAAQTNDGARNPEPATPERAHAPVRATTPREQATATAPTSDVPLAAPMASQAAPAPSAPNVPAPQAAETGGAPRWLYALLAAALAAAAGLFVARKLRAARQDEAEEAYYADPDPAEAQPEIVPSPAPQIAPEPAPEPAAAVASNPSGPVVSTLLRPAPAKSAPVRQPVTAPAAPPAPPPPAPAPAAAAGSGGVVGLAIRPWLNLEFIPDRAAATQTEAVVQYELLIKNVGNMIAGNIRVQARMFNAGADQDEQINAFFSQPIGTGPSVSKVLAIPPRKGARLRSAVSMSNEEVREISVQGRRLFIPLVAINVLYEWGNGRVGQTAASYLVGREPDAPEGKMGPFRLDLGPRVYRSVGQRPNKVALLV